ncbi:MAG: hypothetical protein ACNFW9_01010 [Candidatus Kerfeldbacteria bacterium]|jgi:phage pi2 protein 07
MSLPLPLTVVVVLSDRHSQPYPDNFQRKFATMVAAKFSEIFDRNIGDVLITFTPELTPTVTVESGIFVYFPGGNESIYRSVERVIGEARDKHLLPVVKMYLIPLDPDKTWVGGQLVSTE